MKLAEFISDLNKSENKSNTSDSNTKLILEILRKINSSLVLADVLDLVLKSAISITKSERGFIVLKDEKGNLEFVLCLDSEGQPLSEEIFNISTTVVNEVFQSGQSRYIESAQDDTKNISQSIINLELQTIICAPLITKGEKIGVVYVDSKTLNKLESKEVIELFEIFASQAGIAINNALMHQRQVKANFDLNKANYELEMAKQQAEKFEMLKNHFLIQMSHEIRTPFNIILGGIHLLRSGSMHLDSSEMKDIFDMVDSGGNRIIRTVDEIMEMAKIKSGNYEIRSEAMHLENDILNQVIPVYKEHARKKGVDLLYEKSTEKNEIICDKFTSYQIFQEVIDNAVKFTKKGFVKIKKYITDDGSLAVDVSDTGIGISAEYMNNIFEPFSQEDTGYSRKFEGNGLALALVKKYAEMNNISIDISSKKNVGTTVKLIFK
jgi:signal transduction histidine kinase